jgi:hypothetical protein
VLDILRNVTTTTARPGQGVLFKAGGATTRSCSTEPRNY